MSLSFVGMIEGKEAAIPIPDYMFNKHRIIPIYGEINEALALQTCLSIQALALKTDDPIYLYISSPGGSVSSGLEIIDAMRSCRCDIYTVVTGTAASMAAVIAACGTPGKRYASEHAEIMIHQAIGAVQGQATDIAIACTHIKKTMDVLLSLLAEASGKTIYRVSKDCDRDNWLSATEALNYGKHGLIDYIGNPLFVKEGEAYE